MNEYFSIVSRLLKQNGNVLVFEIHPFAYLFENGIDPEKRGFDPALSYFAQGPHGYEDGLDYVGGVQYEAKECFWFMHKMSDIIKAVLQNGIEIEGFEEYNLEMANNPELMTCGKFPLSYILTGKKK